MRADWALLPRPWVVVLFVLWPLGAAAREARAVCIDASTERDLSRCPSDVKKKATGQRRKVFKSALPERARSARAGAVPRPPENLPPDPRKASRAAKRIRPLLLQEITNLTRLLARTPRKSPDRSELLRRLAEDYVELETIAQSDRSKLEVIAQDHAKQKRRGDADKARRAAARERLVADKARKTAIGYYRRLTTDYPDHRRLDEFLHHLAYEHEQAGDVEAARKVYLALIQKTPKSAYVPQAYLAFGEFFFVEAQADPQKWELARAAYSEVVRYPLPANKVHAYARYKLAYVHWNRGQLAEAMSELKKVVEATASNPQIPSSKGLLAAARRDLVPLYAASGAPERAFAFFSRVSGDPPAEAPRTIAALGELGLAYLDTGHYREAIVLYRDLLGRDSGERSCGYQSRIVEATAALKSSDKEAIEKELLRQLDLRNEFARAGRSVAAVRQCDNRTAELLSETAMAWHLEAVGSGGVRGTGDKRTMALAEKLYLTIAANFTRDDFARFEFPRIVREDWPSRYRIKYARADLLYEQQRWDECGPAFAEVAAEDPSGADTAEALYTSALCYQKSYQRAHAGGTDRRGQGLGPGAAQPASLVTSWERLKPRPMAEGAQRMIEAFDRFLCVVEPPRSPGEARDRFVEVKYARARLYFEAQHWEHAALGFRDVALNHSDHESSSFAADLWLESLNVLYAHAQPKKPGCLDELAIALPPLFDRHCKAGARDAPVASHCASLERVECDVGRKRAEAIVARADGGPEQGKLELYAKAGDAYLALWRKYGKGPIEAGGKAKCQNLDQVVYNMAKAYQAARLLAKAIEARLILLDPRWGMHDTALAKRATYELGQNHQAVAVYDRAADYFERYAKDTEYKGEDADRALSDAVVLRLGLGQQSEALESARRFEQHLGARRPERQSEIAFALASHHAEKDDWEGVRKNLSRSLALIDAKAAYDVRVQAHALNGRALAALGRHADAAREFARTRELWRDPAAAIKAIEAAETDAAARERRVGRAVTAVGEAVFFFAERRRLKAEAMRFPVYRGPGTREAVLKHIQVEVLGWIKHKRPLIEQATAEYEQILALKPAPPPRWVIAAGARVGSMWSEFVREFRAAPVPDAIRKDPPLLAAYWEALDAASEPQKQMARRAFETCTGYSARFQHFDEFSRSCEEWLALNFKADHHLVDEFRGPPNRRNSVLRELSPALALGGRPHAPGGGARRASGRPQGGTGVRRR
jgi:TolA-binding protein